MIIPVDSYRFVRECQSYEQGRKFTLSGLNCLFDYVEENYPPDYRLDVPGLCGPWGEYTAEELYDEYSYKFSYEEWLDDNGHWYSKEEIDGGNAFNDFLEDFLEVVNDNTTVLPIYGTGRYLVLEF